MILLLLSCSAPLAIGEEKSAAASGSVLEQKKLEAKAADPPSEPVKTAVVEKDAVKPPEAPPLVVDLQPQDAGAGDIATPDAFEVVPRAEAGGGDLSFPLPSSSVEAIARDSAMTLAVSSLPGPRQATLEDTPPYSGPVPVGLDSSGHFPLAVLVEKRAKDQQADIALLRSSVEYALGNAAKEIATLKRELDAAKGNEWSVRRLGSCCLLVFVLLTCRWS